ncbi:MAG: DUF1987 domain-containing protein [Crocinitomicaceae bacterium]|nr:MAG: DUF1987 domain-containing protein [Crocinitomicaceae bacterium]
MNNLTLEGSAKTPTISFDTNGKLELKGRSIPENSVEFYKQLNDWIDAYSNVPATSTIVDVKLEYFNTSSSKCILDLFKKLELLHRTGRETVINWYYESDDEDMQEAGLDYKAILTIPFELVEVEEI